MSDSHEDKTNIHWKLYWEREYSTAIAPERLKLDFCPHRPMMTNLNSGHPKLCCGIRFYYPHQLGIMLKDIHNNFYHYPDRPYSIWEGIKSQEYKLTPNLYEFLPGYDAFVSNILLMLEKDMITIQRGDPIAIIIPVLLPKSFSLEELNVSR